jgi:DNA-binding HxlR family transcriptional regulator
MLGRSYDNLDCSVARSLEVIGERWTVLIIRDAFFGVRRFDDFQKDLGIARNVLQTRLTHLVEEGILVRVPYQERPMRHEYRLTEKGIDLWPVIVAMMGWGDRHAGSPAGPPTTLFHRECGGPVTDRGICADCGAVLTARDVRRVVRPDLVEAQTAVPAGAAAGA